MRISRGREFPIPGAVGESQNQEKCLHFELNLLSRDCAALHRTKLFLQKTPQYVNVMRLNGVHRGVRSKLVSRVFKVSRVLADFLLPIKSSGYFMQCHARHLATMYTRVRRTTDRLTSGRSTTQDTIEYGQFKG